MNPIRTLRRRFLAMLSGYLAEPVGGPLPGPGAAELALRLRAGDLILVGGNTRFARLIAALTGSRWTHVAICIRDGDATLADAGDLIVEADLVDGVRLVGLSEFANRELLVLRPAGLDDGARRRLVRYLRGRLGHGYDLEHILSLARLLLARRLRSSSTDAASLRPADPTRAICSTLAARALEAAGLAAAIPLPVAVRAARLAIDQLVPGDFEHATGMATVLDSRKRVAPVLQPVLA